jgi:putative DNA primase/helicase
MTSQGDASDNSSLSLVFGVTDLGWRVIPIHPRSKIPAISDWPEKASRDRKAVEDWSAEYPKCNWGLATGRGSGIFVVDIDVKNNGVKTWLNFEKLHGDVRTVEATTGSGGRHIFFKYPLAAVIKNSASAVGKGIDIRGDGGQVVLPPSIHPNGTAYEWTDGHSPFDLPVAEAPEWLLQKIVKSTPATEVVQLGGELKDGTRNDTIYHHALALARQGADKNLTTMTMLSWRTLSGHSDITDAEITATVDSAYAKASERPDPQHMLEGRTDDDNATRLIQDWGEDIMYATGLGWHTWDGVRWSMDTDDSMILSKVVNSMRHMREEAVNVVTHASTTQELENGRRQLAWAIQSLNYGKLKAVVSLGATRDEIRVTPEMIDPMPTRYKMNFLNGTLDLQTGELTPHAKGDLISKVVACKYDPNAQCPEWLHTMDLAFNGNQGLIDFMQRALGYSISGDTSEQCFFVCWGEGGKNGKSTILEAVTRILGKDYAQMSDMVVITSADTSSNRVASSLARLHGVRFVSMNEAEEDQRISEALVKQLTGGDTIQACRKFKEPFEFTPIFKLWIRTNEKPTVRGISEAFWSRVKLIPFTRSIPVELRKRRDEVDAMLIAEAPGIIAWMVRGFMAWKEHGLMCPTEVSEATSEYHTEQDLVETFVNECTEQGEGFTYRSDAYRAYAGWCKENGYRYVMNAKSFGMRLRMSFPQDGDRNANRVNGRGIWRGMVLNDSAQMLALR